MLFPFIVIQLFLFFSSHKETLADIEIFYDLLSSHPNKDISDKYRCLMKNKFKTFKILRIFYFVTLSKYDTTC
jgi:hypothetical protein